VIVAVSLISSPIVTWVVALVVISGSAGSTFELSLVALQAGTVGERRSSRDVPYPDPATGARGGRRALPPPYKTA
jgi:hypothetical protein